MAKSFPFYLQYYQPVKYVSSGTMSLLGWGVCDQVKGRLLDMEFVLSKATSLLH
jgi:hypothetical protein